MQKNPLKVVATENRTPLPTSPSKNSARIELKAKLERLWLTDPEQFDPKRNSIERERVIRTTSLLQAIPSQAGTAVDLGCGYGEISRFLESAGWSVKAIDIASNALKAFAGRGCENIELAQDALPCTKLEDDAFNLVVCTEVIGYIEPRDHRLFMAELSRLVKHNGIVLCSTGIDIDSEDALQRFGDLAETEFLIEHWNFSHHLWLLRLKHFFEAPKRFSQSSKNPERRRLELAKRTGLSRWWYKVNSAKLSGYFWSVIAWAASPLVHLLKQNKTIMLQLERICKFFSGDSGISHATFIGKRRPLIMPTKADLESVEPKGKRSVWE